MSEIELWRKHLPLITGHAREVAAIPEFYHCQPSHGNLSLSPIGGGHLTLGMLLQLKAQFTLDIECRCGARDFLALNLGGSLLSGRHKFFGLCKACWRDFSGTDPRKFGKFALRAYDLWRRNQLPADIESLTLLQVIWEIAGPDERQSLEAEYNALPSLKDRAAETEPGGLTVRNKRLPPGIF